MKCTETMASSIGFLHCCRMMNHKGPHEARNGAGQVMLTWGLEGGIDRGGRRKANKGGSR